MYRLAAVIGLLCLAVVSTGLGYIAARAGCEDSTADAAMHGPVVDCRFYSMRIGEPVPTVGEPGSVLPPELSDPITHLPAVEMPAPSGPPPLPMPELLPDIADPNALLEAHGLPALQVPVQVQPPQ